MATKNVEYLILSSPLFILLKVELFINLSYSIVCLSAKHTCQKQTLENSLIDFPRWQIFMNVHNFASPSFRPFLFTITQYSSKICESDGDSLRFPKWNTLPGKCFRPSICPLNRLKQFPAFPAKYPRTERPFAPSIAIPPGLDQTGPLFSSRELC